MNRDEDSDNVVCMVDGNKKAHGRELNRFKGDKAEPYRKISWAHRTV